MKKHRIIINKNNIVNPNNKGLFFKYIHEISIYKPLSREEEVELFKQIEKDGNQQAINKVWLHNLLFVVAVAKNYAKLISTSSLTLEDLVNEGNIGLYLAIKKFDYKAGNKFISYAVWLIQVEIIKCITDNIKTIRVPSSVSKEMKTFNKKESYLEQKLCRTPTIEETFDAIHEDKEIKIKRSIERMKEIKEAFNFEKSLNMLMGEDHSVEFYQLIKSHDFIPDESLLNIERKDVLLSILNTLPTEIKYQFIDYFGLNGDRALTISEMSEKYKVNPQTVVNRVDKYLKILKNTKGIKLLLS